MSTSGSPVARARRRFDRRVRWMGGACAGAVSILVGGGLSACGPGLRAAPRLEAGAKAADGAYEDSAWAAVLRDDVVDGRIRYDRLRDRPGPLTAYLARVERVGPRVAPEQFARPADRIAYYVNVYNACVLRSVLLEHVPETVYRLGQRSFEQRYAFVVDGRSVTLARLRADAREAAPGDVRVEFVLCRPALGAPRLPDRPLRAETLERQLADAAASAMDDPRIVRVDHDQRRLLIAVLVRERLNDFMEYGRRVGGGTGNTILDALASMAGPVRRQWLHTASGYPIGVIPFDRRLNRYRPDSGDR